MTCKIVLTPDDICKLREFPQSLEQLKKIVQGKFSKELPPNFDFKYGESTENSQIIHTEQDFVSLIQSLNPDPNNKTFNKPSKLHIVPAKEKADHSYDFSILSGVGDRQPANGAGSDSIFALEFQMNGLPSFHQEPKLQFEDIPLLESTVVAYNPFKPKDSQESYQSLSNQLPNSNFDVIKGLQGVEIGDSLLVGKEFPTEVKTVSIENQKERTGSVEIYHNDNLKYGNLAYIPFTEAQKEVIEQIVNSKVSGLTKIFEVQMETMLNKRLNEAKKEWFKEMQASISKINVIPKSADIDSRISFEEESKEDEESADVFQRKQKRSQTSPLAKDNALNAAMQRYICNECKCHIVGSRYQCLSCKNFDFCEKCRKSVHHPHEFNKIDNEYSFLEEMNQRVAPRRDSLFGKSDQSEKKLTFDIPPNDKQQRHNYYKAKLISDPVNVPSRVAVGTTYDVIFNVKNIGELSWPPSTVLECVNGIYIDSRQATNKLPVNSEREIRLQLDAPEEVGHYSSSWRFAYTDSESNTVKYFGPKMVQELEVVEKPKPRQKDNFIPAGGVHYSEDMQQKANFLMEMFGGDIGKHLEFVRTCESSVTIEEMVERYLQGSCLK